MTKISAHIVVLLYIIEVKSLFAAGALAGDFCKNNGTILKGIHQKCDCPRGYKGFDCSKKIGQCETKPCRNSALCVENNDGTFKCKCKPTYEGILCEKKVTPCEKKPCKNNANCTDDGVKCFHCVCPDGFKGFDCSERVLPCEVSPCQNGGVCSNEKGGSFKCTCNNGYTGVICTKKEPLFGSTVLQGNRKWIKQLEKWLPSELQNMKIKLCYRASVQGWASSIFHTFCDNKGPTVVLIKSGPYIFGGYAASHWGGSSRYIRADSSFIFSFRNRDFLEPFKSPVHQNKAYAIYTSYNNGPVFGANNHDIFIANNAIAGKSSYTNFGNTYKLPPGYSFNTHKAKHLLAGEFNFTPSDVEVYYYVNDEH